MDHAFSDTSAPKNQGWQSRLVLIVVAPYCAIAVLRYALAEWSGPTRNGLAASLVLALLVWLARAATPLAAVTGGILAAALTLAPHSALLPLLVLFLLTFAATKFGRSKKEQLGLADEKRGRNAAQVAANLGVAGLWAATATSHPGMSYTVILVAALAEATADTVASELGEVLGGPPILITTGQRVAPGTNGAVSVAGTAAGAAGAAVVVVVATLAMRLTMRNAGIAWSAAMGGFLIDSLLGATAERKGWLNNDAVNFLSTLAASLIAAATLAL